MDNRGASSPITSNKPPKAVPILGLQIPNLPQGLDAWWVAVRQWEEPDSAGWLVLNLLAFEHRGICPWQSNEEDMGRKLKMGSKGGDGRLEIMVRMTWTSTILVWTCLSVLISFV